MDEQQICDIIADEAKTYGWSLEEALTHLQSIGFAVENVVGNHSFTEHKVRLSVSFAHHAIS